MTDNSIHTLYRRLILQIFQVWLDDRKRDWSTKQESRVEHEPRKLMHNIKEINLYGISKLAMKKPRSYKFHKGKRKGDQTKRKAKGDAVQATYDLTVDAIDEIEIFCYSLILVEHWQNSFHLTCGAIIALESFAFDSMQAIFDCMAIKKRRNAFSQVKANVKRRLPVKSMAKVSIKKQKKQCR